MPLGFDSQTNIVALNDTASLAAYIYDPSGDSARDDDLVSVTFTIQLPDGTRTTATGNIQDDGSGVLNYGGTTQVGEYTVVASFTKVDGTIQSTRSSFEVQDPFNPPSPTERQVVAQRVWRKLEDTFDSNDGGPWLRDMTLNIFNPQDLDDFIDEAIFDINMYNPPTDLNLDYFLKAADPVNAPNVNQPLVVEATTLAVIRHLMRSYTEQPAPQGGQVTYEDRRDYLQRWGTMYQIQLQFYERLVKMWKRKFFGFGQTKGLVSSKAGRLLPAPLRARNIGRGYY